MLTQKYRSFQGSCAWTLPGWNNRSSLISSVMSDHNTFTIFYLVWLVISLLKQYRSFKYLETLLDWASGCTQSWNWIHKNKWETILENFSRSLVESVFMSVRGSQGAESNNTVHCRVSTGTNKVSWTWSYVKWKAKRANALPWENDEESLQKPKTFTKSLSY